eukprot:EG_transcript_11449
MDRSLQADRCLRWLQMAACHWSAWRAPQGGLRSTMWKRSAAVGSPFCPPSSLLPTLPWITLATVATVAQPQSLETTSGTAASDGAASGDVRPSECRLPNAAIQAHLEGYGIDVFKVVQKYPHIALYEVERVQRITSYLTGLDVDVKRIVEFLPNLLASRVEAFEAVVQLLRDNGVDVRSAVNRHPAVLRCKVSSLQHAMDAIVSCGHSVADVVNRHPCFLRTSKSDLSAMLHLQSRSEAAQGRLTGNQQPSIGIAGIARIDAKVAFMSSLGFDADHLLRRAPRVLNYNVDKMHSVVAYLKGLGVNAPNALQKAPHLLGMHPESLQRRAQFFSENGLDVVRIVNGCPQALACRIEQKMRPMLTFMLQEMQYSPSQVNTVPSVWSFSLEGRLRPRLQYLKSLGRPYGALSRFVTLSDERFATIVAKTDLQHYHSFLQKSGHRSPPRQHGNVKGLAAAAE